MVHGLGALGTVADPLPLLRLPPPCHWPGLVEWHRDAMGGDLDSNQKSQVPKQGHRGGNAGEAFSFCLGKVGTAPPSRPVSLSAAHVLSDARGSAGKGLTGHQCYKRCGSFSGSPTSRDACRAGCGERTECGGREVPGGDQYPTAGKPPRSPDGGLRWEPCAPDCGTRGRGQPLPKP